MASIVLSGAQNVSYTNDTGQNVRLVINHLSDVSQITWAGNTKVFTDQRALSNDSPGFFIQGIFIPQQSSIPIPGAGRPYAKTVPRISSDTVLGIGVFDVGGVGSKIYIEDGFQSYTRNTGTFASFIFNDYPRTPFTAGPVINSSVKVFGGMHQRGDNAGGVDDFSPPVQLYDAGTEAVFRSGQQDIRTSIPKTIFLSPGQSFSAICRSYNIVVIKEDGN